MFTTKIVREALSQKSKLCAATLGMLTAVSAIVCPPNYCTQLACPDISSASCQERGQEFSPHSTFCGCCNQCIDYLEDGAGCDLMVPPIFLGVPQVPEKHCKPPSVCYKHVCTAVNN